MEEKFNHNSVLATNLGRQLTLSRVYLRGRNLIANLNEMFLNIYRPSDTIFLWGIGDALCISFSFFNNTSL